MGKIWKILKKEDIGDIGIGAMIVFIAMVLVAGIAASVIIQTANRLEMQAMATGQETTGEVATGLHVLDIEGEKWSNTANTGNLANMTITVQPRAGSYDIDLEQAYVEICDSSRKCVLTYLSTEFHLKSEINGDLFQTGFYDSLTSQTFGVIVLEDADSSLSSSNPVVNRGDKVMLTVCLFDCFGDTGVGERRDVWGLVQPEEGAPAVFAFRTPSSYAGDSVFDLY